MNSQYFGLRIGKSLRAFSLFAMLALTVIAAPRDAQAVTITPDAGWVDAEISSYTDVINFTFLLTNKAYFSLTDAFVLADTWTITGSFSGSSAVGATNLVGPLGLGSFFSHFDPAWADPLASHFQTLLSAGSYSIFVSGDGAGGVPAGFGVRIDTAAVPLPAAGLLLLGAMGGLGALSRRRKAGLAA
jgi:hypothetical protein